LHEASGLIVDPHTADGIKVAREQRGDEPILCLETALPAKFAETIVEAIGIEPPRPPATIGIENLPQRCESMGVDVDAVKRFIEARA
jgi:threonine synthase